MLVMSQTKDVLKEFFSQDKPRDPAVALLPKNLNERAEKYLFNT